MSHRWAIDPYGALKGLYGLEWRFDSLAISLIDTDMRSPHDIRSHSHDESILTTIPAGWSNTDKIMTGVVIGAFFYFECGQFPRLNSVKGNGDQLLTVAMSELLAMVPSSTRRS